MIWTVLILAILAFIGYNFFKDRDKMLRHQVDTYGGMTNKYSYLITELTRDPSAKVVKETRDLIHIRSEAQTTATNFIIRELFGKVEIEWIAQWGVYGTLKNKWGFQPNYPQDKMLQEILTYLEWKNQEVFGETVTPHLSNSKVNEEIISETEEKIMPFNKKRTIANVPIEITNLTVILDTEKLQYEEDYYYDDNGEVIYEAFIIDFCFNYSREGESEIISKEGYITCSNTEVPELFSELHPDYIAIKELLKKRILKTKRASRELDVFRHSEEIEDASLLQILEILGKNKQAGENDLGATEILFKAAYNRIYMAVEIGTDDYSAF